MDGEIFYCPSKNEDVFFSKLEAIIASIRMICGIVAM